VVTLAVLTRYVFKVPILGSVELSRLLFIWACFLAAALCYYQKSHIAITFIADRLPAKAQRVLHTFLHGLSILFFGTLFYASLEVMRALWVSDLPMLGISQGWLYVPLPLMSLIMLLYALEFLQDNEQTPPGDMENVKR